MRFWIAALLVFAGGSPGAAAPLTAEPRAPAVRLYDAAARRAGFGAWGTTLRGGATAHVMFRLAPTRAVLTFGLPPTVTPQEADPWLNGLVSKLGWTDAELSYFRAPGALLLRVQTSAPVQRAGFGQNRASLDVDLIRKAVQEIAPGPVLLAVASRSASLSPGVPAAAEAEIAGDNYAFYALTGSGAPAGVLTASFGIPFRWLLAAGVTMLLWLVFPVVALFLVRRRLGEEEGLDARQRLDSYRRWQRGLAFTVLIGAMVSFFVFGIGKMAYLTLTGMGMLPFFSFMLPPYVVSLAGRLIGIPLEREAWPARKDLKWYQIASMELTTAAITLVILGGVGLMLGSIGGTAATGRVGTPNIGFVFLGVLGFVAALPIAGLLIQKYQRKKIQTERPEAPPEVLARVLELVGPDCPVQTVRVNPSSTWAGGAVVFGNMAVVSQELMSALDAEQIAALVAAGVLAQPRKLADRVVQWSWLLMLLPFLAILGPMAWSAFSGGSPSRSLPTLFPILIPLAIIPGLVMSRRLQKLQEEADVRVAESLGEPRRFLDALKYVEEAQLANFAMASGQNRQSPYAMRRTRLQNRLGLD